MAGDEPYSVTPPVLFLSRSQVTKCLDPRPLVELLGDAFQEHSTRTRRTTAGSTFNVDAGSLSVSTLGASLDIPAYTVKVEANAPGKSPSITGLIHLYDQETGRLLAILESSYISAVSSALTAALATDLMAVPDARRLAVIGTGTQGWLGTRFLMEMRSLEEVYLFDLSRRRCNRIAERLRKYKSLEVKVCDALTDTVANADIILCATWSKRPFLFSEMVMPGAHITTLGADSKGKKEVSAELLRTSYFFCDDRELAVSVGALQGVKGGRELIKGELGEILAGDVEARISTSSITIYGPTGLPFQDLIAAWATYQQALRKKQGTPIPYLK